MPLFPVDDSRTLVWAHGRAELQRLGAMLAPVVFRLPDRPDFSPMQVAPWADEQAAATLPGILRRLRGEWPCVPFGRTDPVAGLPAGWSQRGAGDDWGHGFGAHHAWDWLPQADPHTLGLAIDHPAQSPVERLERHVRALPDRPALEITLKIHVRHACRLPVALHPTLRLDAGAVTLQVEHDGPALTYPVPAEPGISRLAVDRRFERLAAAPLAEGGVVDLSRFPLAIDTEELLQLTQVRGPVAVDYADAGASLALDWDRTLLPDLMLWVSHRGRTAWPWNGRHWALGVEPVNGPFDLGRVARPPQGHPAARSGGGLDLQPGAPTVIRASLEARPLHR